MSDERSDACAARVRLCVIANVVVPNTFRFLLMELRLSSAN